MATDYTQYLGNSRWAVGGWTASGQNQLMAGADVVQAGTSTVDKGGMRAAGLIAAMLGEIAMRNKVANLADNYYNTNRQDYAFFAGTHQPAMQRTRDEAFSPTTNPTYTTDRYASVASGVGMSGVVDHQWFEARRRLPKYNTGQGRRLDFDMAIARLHAATSGWALGTRYEEDWAKAHNKRAWNRKVAMANIGIGVGNIVRHGVGTATAALSTAYNNVGNTVGSIGNGLAANLGYTFGAQTAARTIGQRNGNP